MDPEQTPDSAADAAVPPTTPVPHAPGSSPVGASPVGPSPAGASPAGSASPGGTAPGDTAAYPAGAAAYPPPPGYAPPSGYGTAPAAAPRQYPAPIGWVIAAVILFWPTAIPALLASHRSARAAGAGDVATADREAASAKRWGIISVCVGAAVIVLSLIAAFVWALVVAVAVHDHRDGFGWHERGGSTQIQPFGRSDGSQQVGPGGRSGGGQLMPGRPGTGSNGSGSNGSGSNGSGSNGKGYGFGRHGMGGSSGSGSGSATPTPAPTSSNG